MIQLTHTFIAEFISFVLNCPDRSVRLSLLLTVNAALWPSQNRKKIVTLTIKEKADVQKEKQKGKSYRQLAEQFGVSKTQIGDIFKRKRETVDAVENKNLPDSKRIKTNQR